MKHSHKGTFRDFLTQGKNALEINNRFKKDGAIMEDDSGLPKMVEKWSHTVTQWS